MRPLAPLRWTAPASPLLLAHTATAESASAGATTAASGNALAALALSIALAALGVTAVVRALRESPSQ